MAARASTVIIGAGLGGAYTARALRDTGYDGAIRMIGEEPRAPYLRPLLSKDFLLGTAGLDDLAVRPEHWYADQDVALLTGVRATAIEAADHRVRLDDGSAVDYDSLVLAPGSEPRRMFVPGAELDGVHSLRRLDDAERLRAELVRGGRRLVVIGGGWIGTEIAAGARQLGNDVTVVVRGPQPFGGMPDELAAEFVRLHREHGVVLHAGASPAELTGAASVTGVTLDDDGGRLDADLVLIAIGAVPRIELAADAGLPIEDGIHVDAALRTDAPDILAVGDVADVPNPRFGGRIRTEHWANARATAKAAAETIAGRAGEFDPLPYSGTEQFGHVIGISGFLQRARGRDAIRRTDHDGMLRALIWLDEAGRPLAAATFDDPDADAPLQRLIRDRAPVDADRLADRDVPWEAVPA